MKSRTHYVLPTASATACGLPLKRGNRSSNQPTCPTCQRIKGDAAHIAVMQRQLDRYSSPEGLHVVFRVRDEERGIRSPMTVRFLSAEVVTQRESRVLEVRVAVDRLREIDPGAVDRATVEGWSEMMLALNQQHPSAFMRAGRGLPMWGGA